MGAVAKVSYTHDAMIDRIIAEPSVSKTTLAKEFGYTVGWVSQVVNSDAFQARLAERKSELVDPALTLTVEEKLVAIAQVSADKLIDKLSQPLVEPSLAMESLNLSTKALGYGARGQGQGPVVNNNYVVALPPRSETTEDWETKYKDGIPAQGQTIDAEPVKDA